MLLRLLLLLLLVLLLLLMLLFFVHIASILDFHLLVGLASVAENPSEWIAHQREIRVMRVLLPVSSRSPVLACRLHLLLAASA